VLGANRVTRFFIALSFLLIVVFTGATAILRARPYDDSELRAFLRPSDGCPAPCFMGIRPGITPFQEALSILQKHEWVKRINTLVPASREWFSVTWSGRQPDMIDVSGTASVQGNNGIVQAIAIPVRAPLGDIFADWGLPVWSNGNIGGLGLQYSVGFQDVPLQVGFVFTENPRKIRNILNAQKATIYFRSAVPDMVKPHPSLMDFITLNALTSWE
jgi:hypothetical protein